MTEPRDPAENADTEVVDTVQPEDTPWAPTEDQTAQQVPDVADAEETHRLREVSAAPEQAVLPPAVEHAAIPAPAEQAAIPAAEPHPEIAVTPPASAPLEVPSAPTEAIFRPVSPVTPSETEPTVYDAVSAEEQKLAAERAARREARALALAATAPVADAAPAPVVITKVSTDKWLGSMGLLILRWVTAAIMAVHGMNLLTDLEAAQELFATTLIPEPSIMAIVTGVGCLLTALALILGLLTRVAGVGVAVIAGGALAFYLWGSWSPFLPGRPGFLGELELLLTAVGLTFATVGAGGWSLDRSLRAGRERDKAEKAARANQAAS